jgi:hypothetical protein
MMGLRHSSSVAPQDRIRAQPYDGVGEAAREDWIGNSMTRKVARFADELADREAIRDCLVRFSRALDRIELAGSGELYWPGGIDDHGGLFRGTFEEYFPFASVSSARWR